MEYRISIDSEPDATRAVMQTRRSAAQAGFDPAKVSMLGTVASELVRNILKYAGSGELIVRTFDAGARTSVEIIARDRGPGIDDVARAMQDHVSTGGTLGLGLPGVKRMMDSFHIESRPGEGTTVTVSKWMLRRPADDKVQHPDMSPLPPDPDVEVEPPTSGRAESTFDIGWYVRPADGFAEGGDTVVVNEGRERTLVAVIDVLGHGPDAYRLASQVEDLLAETEVMDVTRLAEMLHAELRGSLGAAIGLVALDRSDGRATYLGIGNIVAKVYDDDERALHSSDGIVGQGSLTMRPTAFTLEQGQTLVLHSDGISSRIGLQDYPQIVGEDPMFASREFIRRFGRGHDDASCVIVRRLT